jgi:hypothetical protein
LEKKNERKGGKEERTVKEISDGKSKKRKKIKAMNEEREEKK